ncbi:MAG: alpha/beta hydrolase [Candidatus Eremiobacteraeota bacterium]|nr:alpha/beta hydrolase [Candidatus Eremiobacteraeota bacterium]MBV9264275.1 alpha/beta hydrolase [Candidatus Eremiobacteraeota bacterium]
MRRLALGITLLALLCGPSVAARASVAQRHVAPAATFDSGILRVERFGRAGARPIVFIPALFCGSWQWNAQINALSTSYDLFVVTLPGFDGRPMVAGDDLMNRAARSIAALIVARHLRRPILLGHSLGGTLAVYFAERYPSDVSNVVTVEGGMPEGPTPAARERAVARETAPFRGIPQGKLGAVLREQQLQYTITGAADVATVERYASRSQPRAIVDWMRAAFLLDLTPDLTKIAAPFTVIVPFEPRIDPYVGFATADAKRAAYVRWAAHARNSKVILIQPARHFVMFDEPEEFERALEAALER